MKSKNFSLHSFLDLRRRTTWLAPLLLVNCATSASDLETSESSGGMGAELSSGGHSIVDGTGGTTSTTIGSGGSQQTSGGSQQTSGGSQQTSGGSQQTSGGSSPGTGGLKGAGGALGSGGGADEQGGTRASGGVNGSGGVLGAGGTIAIEPYTPCPKSGVPCAILPLGDSITEGYGSSGGGYRVELFRQAIRENKNITFVGTQENGPDMVDGSPFPRNHQGHGGYTIDSDASHSGISGPITDGALDNYKPHIVLLMIGTNDINGYVDLDNAPGRLRQLLDEIVHQAPETLVVITTICPVINDETNQNIANYNSALTNIALELKEAGEHVILLDNYSAFFDRSDWQTALMNDNLHPNDAGYVEMGQSFYNAISSYLP